MLEEAKRNGDEAAAKPRGKRKNPLAGTIDYGEESHRFMAEVTKMVERYSRLSQWLIHLLNEKRSAAGVAVAGPSSSALV
jgi:hypothetical protein